MARTTTAKHPGGQAGASARPGARRRIDEPRLAPSPVVLLLVDFINPLNFAGAERLAPRAVAAATACARLRRRVRRQGLQTIYANDNYGVWRADFADLWRRCSRAPGAPGAVARTLRPLAGDCTLLKPRHSAFHGTALDLLLRQLACRRLIVTGLAADSCVLFTAMDAYLRGYELWVPEDCTAAETAEDERAALAQMQRVLKAHTRAAI
ncbi:MAG: cysteine hydrolase [Rubrivivax sp.]|nr:cysteine hydrolase [Rubrivivax sp.]